MKPTVNRERQFVKFETEITWPEGTPDELIEFANDIKKEYANCKDIVIQYQRTGYEDYHYEIVGLRLETDAEKTNRIYCEEQAVVKWEKQQAHEERQRLEQEAARARKKKAQEEKELAEYKRLAEKYGELK